MYYFILFASPLRRLADFSDLARQGIVMQMTLRGISTHGKKRVENMIQKDSSSGNVLTTGADPEVN